MKENTFAARSGVAFRVKAPGRIADFLAWMLREGISGSWSQSSPDFFMGVVFHEGEGPNRVIEWLREQGLTEDVEKTG